MATNPTYHDHLEKYLHRQEEISEEAGRAADTAFGEPLEERPAALESDLAADRPPGKGVQGSGAVDTADPLTIAEQDNVQALARDRQRSREEHRLSGGLRQRLTRDLKESGAKTAAPTDSGGLVGSTMGGGGDLGDPEVTDDRMGNPGGAGPEVLEVGPDRDPST